jgi:hypothetical protein
MRKFDPAVTNDERPVRRSIAAALKSSARYLTDGARSLVRKVYIDIDADPKNTIFLAGTGRSGSSWVANIVNYRNEFRYMFEPFFPARVPECRHFAYRQYLRTGDLDPAFVTPARCIVSGRIRNDWIDQFNRKVVSRKRVIKDIRANLMLGWLKRRFPEMRIVLVLRHPLADANSRLALGWRSHLDELARQPDLWSDFLAPFSSVIESARTDFEKHVVLWCVENLVPLRQLSGDAVHLTFYENLCERPDLEIQRLFDFLGLPIRREVFARSRQPTSLTREESAILRGGNPIEAWRAGVSTEQRDKGMEIVRAFGLDVLYGEGSLPNIDAAFAFASTKHQEAAWNA